MTLTSLDSPLQIGEDEADGEDHGQVPELVEEREPDRVVGDEERDGAQVGEGEEEEQKDPDEGSDLDAVLGGADVLGDSLLRWR